ncbi:MULTISPECIES: response regulator transcription factor [Carboxydothermus]|uniref:Stage 0 sporulation protein A homolog n=2 Tax=Carboxydothermus TaxID=129957 RepID=Q3AAG8_CARHZ|nr:MULTISPECIES: response regulator transcription factor [Carboxydothermus]ABB15742.1 DNA-binding response regulator [Carboxydothermus hydrogenoformans Z-2901]NYE58760.1 two-component system alkaline phosphatase synthesis response regulator PhoP [Carboxydothermus ferrireducens DSM 11255]
MKILVVDDEAPIVELIKFNLEREGYKVLEAYDGIRALEIVKKELPDLVILDIMLPGMSGLEVCKNIRNNEKTAEIPIIMLSARGEEVDKILGLELGADDYMVKPFSPRELVARVKARLRRLEGREGKKEGIIKIKDIVIDQEKFAVYVKGKKMDFTPKEFELLKLLASNPGKVFTREYLLEKIWGYEFLGDTRTVDVHIRHIRQKIEDNPADPVYIETVRGVGYRFGEEKK